MFTPFFFFVSNTFLCIFIFFKYFYSFVCGLILNKKIKKIRDYIDILADDLFFFFFGNPVCGPQDCNVFTEWPARSFGLAVPGLNVIVVIPALGLFGRTLVSSRTERGLEGG